MRIGCQIAIWRGALDLSSALAAASALGCRGVEAFDTDIMSYYGKEGPLRDELQQTGVVLTGAYFTSPDFANAEVGRGLLNRVKTLCDFLKAVSAEFLVMGGGPPRQPGQQFTEAEFAQCAAAMNRLGREAQGRGLQAVVHPRQRCMVETPADVDRLLAAGLNTEVVGLCPHAGHQQGAGADPYVIYEQYASQVRYLHIGDLDAHNRGVLDQPRLMKPLLEAGYDGWVIIDGDHEEASGHDYVRHAQRYLTAQWPEVRWEGDGRGVEESKSRGVGNGRERGREG